MEYHDHAYSHNNHKHPNIVNSSAMGWRKFSPLIVIFSLIILFTLGAILARGNFDFVFAMRMFEGMFFIIFGGFKIFNLRGFAEAYTTYDLLAARSTSYAFFYPFIELLLGVSFLTSFFLYQALWLTLVLMVIGAVGVLQKLLLREPVMCACLGVVFKVPMTWVTFFEDVLMGLMAATMLFLI